MGLILFLCFGIVNPVNAGFFSFLDKLIGSDEKEENFNSQNIPLLSTEVGSLGGANAIGGTVFNVEDPVLSPSIGPLGSIADIDTYKLDQITTYTVREGDSLSKIAKMFDVDVGTIYWANDLKRGDRIKPGEVLVVLPISGVQHEIKKGETITSIAKKYKSDEEEISIFNNLELDALKVGMTIIIPNAELSPIPSRVSTGVTKGTGGPNLIGYFIRPISGGRKSQGLHGFNGVDLANSCGSPVFASAAGTVLVSRSFGWNGGYGSYVVIAHPNGTQTLYSHLSSVLASVGQYVPQGLKIGAVGSTGHSTGCHVHFEVRGAKNPF